MSKDLMDYGRMVEGALRGVVRQALCRAAEEGLPGSHHLYLSFRTGAPGVDLSDRLLQKHPEEMTIVLQHQFWGLEVDDEAFAVTLSFGGAQERLRVPFAALTAFFDPSVEFGLRFQPAGAPAVGETAAAGKGEAGREEQVEPSAQGEAGKVVTLDQFRKK